MKQRLPAAIRAMNAISAFFVRNIVAVFFFYGLAFFVMGVALLFASRRASQFRFARAILPLAAFGLLHAAHEWVEMYQKIGALAQGYAPSVVDEVFRITLLLASFVMLLIFGSVLLLPEPIRPVRMVLPIGAIVLLWGTGVLVVAMRFGLTPVNATAVADGLARYTIGIPAAIIGTWALMAQQRTFREHDMPEFGRDLVWSAAALFLYGAIGQLFVRESVLAPSHWISSAAFLQWFGIPVQLFRAVMAGGLTFFLVRALRAFELEGERRLTQANTARMAAQAAALEAERRTSHQMEQLNAELRTGAHRLALLLDLSNYLDTPESLDLRFRAVLERIVQALPFSEAGALLLVKGQGEAPMVAAVTEALQESFAVGSSAGDEDVAPSLPAVVDLGQRAVLENALICDYVDGDRVAAPIEAGSERSAFIDAQRPVRSIGLPLVSQHGVIGSIVLVQPRSENYLISPSELNLMVGVAQQLGLSVDNALLYDEAQQREKVLAELLRQVVGAQEAERQRIACELHDATGQSLTAVAMGLSGLEAAFKQRPSDETIRRGVEQIPELRSFSTNALGELRTIISDLRPPQLDDLGLVAALRWYIQAYERRRSIATTFTVEGQDTQLPSEYKIVLFRITQEALTNVAKHAGAQRVDVALEITAGLVRLTVRDDGRGFDASILDRAEAEPGVGWGIVGIRERTLQLGGWCDIKTAPGQGTTIAVIVPLNQTAVWPEQSIGASP